MKYLILIFIFFNILTANQSELTKEEKEWIQNNEIIVGIEQWYPIIYTDKNNQMDGLIGDIFKLIIKKYNLKTKVMTGEWADVLSQFKAGQIDLIPFAIYTKERAKFGLYSKVVHSTKDYLYIKKGNDTTLTFEMLSNKKLAITKDNGTIPKVKEKFPNIHIIETKNYAESIHMVLNGKVDAMYESHIAVELFLTNNLITGLKGLSQNSFKASNLHFISNINKPILHSILQKGLNTLTPADHKQITYKWLHKEIEITKLILTNTEKTHLVKKSNIKMCVDPNWMPFEKIKNGKHIGIAADYIQIFQNKLGIPIDLVETKTWSQSLVYVKNRKCDILALAMSIPSRQKYMNFTKPYLKVPLVLVTKKDTIFITDLNQLSNKTIGIQKDYGYNELIRNKYPNINIIEVKDLEEGFSKVEKGELFGHISTNISAAYLFQTKFAGSLEISGKFDEDWELGVAVRSDDLILFDIFEKIISSLNEETKQNILNRWISIKYEKGFDYSLFWKIFFFGAIIILFFIYKHILLNKHNLELQTAKKEIEELNTMLEQRVEERTHALKFSNKKLEEKTIELENLNNTLDIRIKDEINKREEQEQILIQQSRLAAMGEMISMIAHQWRQPLSALSVIIQNIELSYSIGKLEKHFLADQIQKSNALTEKMSRTIEDFRGFFKPNKEKHSFSLHAAIQQTIFLIDDSFRNNEIKIISNLDEDVVIYGFKNELSQVLLNILTNSQDALLENNIENPNIHIRVEKGIDYGKIFISDNAGGIDNKIIPKIFDPYFTTKESKNGTGLGLYMSKMIIEQNMNGKLSIQNIPHGAEFCIYIPIN